MGTYIFALLKFLRRPHKFDAICLKVSTLLMPCPFAGPKMFCARPKIYSDIVAVTKILRQTKRRFAFSKIGFCGGTKCFEEALNAVKLLGWHKKI